jgi:D-alanyl-D-alanine carboxypeptidase
MRFNTIVNHGGDTTGFTSQVIRVPQVEMSIILLTNQQRRNNIVTAVAERSVGLLLGKPFPTYQAMSLAETKLIAFEGIYVSGDKPERTIKRTLTGLTMQAGRDTIVMLPYSDAEFFIPETTLTRYRFERDAKGLVTRMIRIGSDDQEEVFGRK